MQIINATNYHFSRAFYAKDICIHLLYPVYSLYLLWPNLELEFIWHTDNNR